MVKHYNYFRDYDARIGRYAESDPVGLKAGLSTYAYVASDPLSSRDSFGLMEDCDCAGGGDADDDPSDDSSPLGLAATLGGGGGLAGLIKRCKNIRCKDPEVHDSHHTFKVVGRQCHLQLNCYIKGLKRSGRAIRVPYPCDWAAPPGFTDRRRKS